MTEGPGRVARRFSRVMAGGPHVLPTTQGEGTMSDTAHDETSKTAETMMVEALRSIQMMKCPHTNGCICLYHAKVMARDTLWRIGAA
jgi:hypothetical protein